MVRNKGYKTYETGHVTIKLTSFCVMRNASLHQLPKNTEIVTLVESQALRSHEDYECAGILLCLMFKIRYKCTEAVALNSLSGCLTQSLHHQRHKKEMKQ